MWIISCHSSFSIFPLSIIIIWIYLLHGFIVQRMYKSMYKNCTYCNSNGAIAYIRWFGKGIFQKDIVSRILCSYKVYFRKYRCTIKIWIYFASPEIIGLCIRVLIFLNYIHCTHTVEVVPFLQSLRTRKEKIHCHLKEVKHLEIFIITRYFYLLPMLSTPINFWSTILLQSYRNEFFKELLIRFFNILNAHTKWKNFKE